MLRSVDSVSEKDGMHHTYPAEFFQQLNACGLPLVILCLKVGSPVILLRNIDRECCISHDNLKGCLITILFFSPFTLMPI